MSFPHHLITLQTIAGGGLLFRQVPAQVVTRDANERPLMVRILDENEVPGPDMDITTAYLVDEQFRRNQT